MLTAADIHAKLAAMSPEQLAEIEANVSKAMVGRKFIANPGPQSQAYFSKADVTLFGGCVSGDTEYLTPFGWKRIEEYEGGAVAQWDNGELTFAAPTRYIEQPCESLIEFSSSRMSMVLSDNHRMPLYNYEGKFVVKEAREIAALPSKYRVPINYSVFTSGIAMAEDQIRLSVAVHADGNLYVRKDGSARCRMSLRKERKKQRLKMLLQKMGIVWREYHNPNRPTEVRYEFDSPCNTKKFEGEWWSSSQEQLEIILEEISYWDGCVAGTTGGDICYYSQWKCDADFLQYAAHACGRAASIGVRSGTKDRHKTIYVLNVTHPGSIKSTIAIRKDVTSIRRLPADKMFCFEVPSSFWLARHGDRIFVTGNSPGGGKSALEIGLALNEHHRSLIVRKNFADLGGLIDTAKKIVGSSKGFVGGTRPEYRKEDGGIIHFAGLSEDGGIGGHQGVDHDLICVDESATVPENQIRLLMGWLRTDKKGQRCRVIFGSNPPLDTTGDWLVDYFAPWLDATHPDPAKPGELRYFLRGLDGVDRECKPDDFVIIDGTKVRPQSRTFIPSKHTDNPFYDSEEYAKQLANLPEHVREILTTGNFMLARKDPQRQLIPTDWVRAAMKRWTPKPPPGSQMSAIGIDPACGGEDESTLAPRYDGWYAPIIAVPGAKTPSGAELASLIFQNRKDGASVIIDMGGGYGGSPYEHLISNQITAIRYLGQKTSTARSRDGFYKFQNKRSESWWKFREALDPYQEGGSPISLPDDPKLLSDLTSVWYTSEIAKGIVVESKDQIKKRIHRSPDRGDAVVMAWHDGQRPYGQPASPIITQRRSSRGAAPKVNLGHDKQRRRT